MSTPLASRIGPQRGPQPSQGSLMSNLPGIMKQARQVIAVINAAQNPQKALMDYCDKSGVFEGYTGSRDPESMARWLAEKNGVPLDDVITMLHGPGAQGLGNKLTKFMKGGF